MGSHDTITGEAEVEAEVEGCWCVVSLDNSERSTLDSRKATWGSWETGDTVKSGKMGVSELSYFPVFELPQTGLHTAEGGGSGD
jgi:hypothetical protein